MATSLIKTPQSNIQIASLNVASTYTLGTATIEFHKKHGIVHCYWKGSVPKFPEGGTAYEIGTAPVGFRPKDDMLVYGVDMTSFQKGLYFRIATTGKITIYGYNTGTSENFVNVAPQMVYMVDESV